MPSNKSGFERQRADGDPEPVHRRRLLGLTFKPDFEVVHQVGEEYEELHLGKILTEASALSNSERNNARMWNEGAIFIQKPLRLELIWLGESFWIHVDVGQVWNDAGAGWEGELPDGCC